MTLELQELNQELVAAEQAQQPEIFSAVLSEKLLFRRANGTVIGKAEFLKDLPQPSPFTERIAENIQVTALPGVADRALVTLIVRTRKADGAMQCFRNTRFFTRTAAGWELDAWYNYEITCP